MLELLCLLLLYQRPGLHQSTESDLLRPWGSRQTAHDSMLGNAWHTLFLSTDLKHSSKLTKVIYGDWMTGTVPFFSSLSPPSPMDYEEG